MGWWLCCILFLSGSSLLAQDETPAATERVSPTMTLTPALTSTPAAPIFDVPPGRYEGLIDAVNPAARYRVALQAGQIITVTMETTSGDLDPSLLLFDESETLLASNDDIAVGDRRAQIVLTVPIEGAYIIEATRFNQTTNAGRGTYLLRIDAAGDGSAVETDDPLSVPPPFTVD
ncbi:MAG: hypothetical protein HC793_02130 [Aquincola sp.]|nr:hypothetical protein [Aquincola sp.]